MYYGGRFLLFELSTPFLNFHWFMDKLSLTGSKLQLVNGIILLNVFFFARIAYGWYTSIDFYFLTLANIHRFPFVLFAFYAVSNTILNGLNVFWFYKMIASATRRFSGKPVNKDE